MYLESFLYTLANDNEPERYANSLGMEVSGDFLIHAKLADSWYVIPIWYDPDLPER